MAHVSELAATRRDRVGKGAARQLRRESKIPAVIYGDKKDPISIALPYKEAFMALHGGGFLTNIMTIDVEGEKIKVLPRDYQLDPVRDFLVHIDFLRVSANTRIAVNVPVHFLNEEKSPGLKAGGVLNIVRHEVELECPAGSIPNALEINVSGLGLGDSVHISSVNLPKGVVPTITDRDFTIATIAAPAGLKSDEDESEVAIAPDEVELIGEDKEGSEE
jgi:large subunit ribosomal protein L25